MIETQGVRIHDLPWDLTALLGNRDHILILS